MQVAVSSSPTYRVASGRRPGQIIALLVLGLVTAGVPVASAGTNASARARAILKKTKADTRAPVKELIHGLYEIVPLLMAFDRQLLHGSKDPTEITPSKTENEFISKLYSEGRRAVDEGIKDRAVAKDQLIAPGLMNRVLDKTPVFIAKPIKRKLHSMMINQFLWRSNRIDFFDVEEDGSRRKRTAKQPTEQADRPTLKDVSTEEVAPKDLRPDQIRDQLNTGLALLHDLSGRRKGDDLLQKLDGTLPLYMAQKQKYLSDSKYSETGRLANAALTEIAGALNKITQAALKVVQNQDAGVLALEKVLQDMGLADPFFSAHRMVIRHESPKKVIRENASRPIDDGTGASNDPLTR